jgi:DNA-binding FadR family transcriptional regulator
MIATLAPSRERRLAEVLYDSLLARVVDGTYAPASRLPSETELAGEFGVSRPIVREALARLRRDGLVVSRQGSGTFVQRHPDEEVPRFRPLSSVAEISQWFEFRAMVEGTAAALAAERIDAAGLARVEAASAAFEAVVAEGGASSAEDFAFHLVIAECGRNRYFVEVLQMLRPHLMMVVALSRSLTTRYVDMQKQQTRQEHQAVLDALRRRDPAAARGAMLRHIENTRWRLFEGDPTRRADP